jgi:hypothetical protein
MYENYLCVYSEKLIFLNANWTWVRIPPSPPEFKIFYKKASQLLQGG